MWSVGACVGAWHGVYEAGRENGVRDGRKPAHNGWANIERQPIPGWLGQSSESPSGALNVAFTRGSSLRRR